MAYTGHPAGVEKLSGVSVLLSSICQRFCLHCSSTRPAYPKEQSLCGILLSECLSVVEGET